MIYGTRVRAAREFRQMQQGDLAKALEISPGRLTQIETSTEVELEPARLERLVAALRMPDGYFMRVPIEGISEGSMRFRSQARVPKKVRNAVRREAELGLELFAHLLGRVDVAPVTLPMMAADTPIEEAAQATRAALGIAPDVVLTRAIKPLEQAGIVIVCTSAEDDRLDAFSTFWDPGRSHPVIAISDNQSWDRYRFTLWHEAAHLILHRGPGMADMTSKEVERDANRFASAVMMPRDRALEEFPRPVTLRQLLPLKQRWGMSIQALVSRGREVGVIDEAQATSLWKQISARQWRKDEPLGDLQHRERPRALRQMAELAYGNPINTTALARDVGRYRVDVETELDRYAAGTSRPTAARTAPRADDSADVIDLLRWRSR